MHACTYKSRIRDAEVGNIEKFVDITCTSWLTEAAAAPVSHLAFFDVYFWRVFVL